MTASPQIKDSDLAKPGLIFDADTVTLLGKFTDEFSAYRGRKQWMEVFAHYFLLERTRDYDTEVGAIEGTDYFFLRCTFSSACGRYAFWRLVNHQALEAEEKLHAHNMVNKKSARFLLGSIWSAGHDSPWILPGEQPRHTPRRGGTQIFKNLLATIQKALNN
jgi:hypothetical protein